MPLPKETQQNSVMMNGCTMGDGEIMGIWLNPLDDDLVGPTLFNGGFGKEASIEQQQWLIIEPTGI